MPHSVATPSTSDMALGESEASCVAGHVIAVNEAEIELGFRAQLQPGVKGGCRRQADGTAGLPPAPEMPCVPR